MASRVDVDTSALVRGINKLAAGLSSGGPLAARAQAEVTARNIASKVPVRSGRLRATVTTESTRDGADVLYGGGLPYANYIEHRSHAVEEGTTDAPEAFRRAAEDMARKVVRTL